VIASLVAIAAPFVISMHLHEKSARGFSAGIEARRVAEAARNDAVAALFATHPDEERRARLARADQDGDDEGWDSLEEISPRTRDLAGVNRLAAHGTRSTMQDVSVRDERSKLDLNTAGASPIANLLGATVTTEDVSWDETRFLPLEDVSPFFSDGDKATLDGIVQVNGEFIGYRDVSKNPPGLRGLVRGMFFTRSPPPEREAQRQHFHLAGSLVQDFRGAKIALDAVARFQASDREGDAARFETPSAVRKIADWELGTYTAARAMHDFALTPERLRGWGVTRAKLLRAGLDPAVLDETTTLAAVDLRRLEAAEKGLSHFWLSPKRLRRFGGEHLVLRAWAALEPLGPSERQRKAEEFERALNAAEDGAPVIDEFWRNEIKRQLDLLVALREKSPEIETIGRVELERLRPFLTVDAAHAGEAWSDPQVVTEGVSYSLFSQQAGFAVRDTRLFREGMLLRIKPRAGGDPEYRMISAIGNGAVYVYPELPEDWKAGTLEVSALQPKPINVNAAPREVLIAALTGLETTLFRPRSVTGYLAPNIVTPAEAAAVADRILAAPLHSHGDLKALLEQAKLDHVIDAGGAEAILANSVNPQSPTLVRSSVPFAYASGDVYEITATGIVNDDQANEVSHVRTREIVQVAPPRDLVWTLDSQADFQDRIGMRPEVDPNTPLAPPGRFVPLAPPLATAQVLGRLSNLLETFPLDMSVAPWLVPDRRHSGPGYIQLQTGRDWDQPQAQLTRVVGGAYPGDRHVTSEPAWTEGVIAADHWDREREGHPVAGPFAEPAANLATRVFALEDGTVRRHLGPGTVRCWFKVGALAGKTSLVDVNKDSPERLSLVYDADARELVASVHDETLDIREGGGSVRPTVEVRAAANLRRGNWYHVALAWKGGERGDLAIVLDGKPIGAEAGVGTKLTGAASASALTLEVESTRGFPDRGWLRVGGLRLPDGTLGALGGHTAAELSPGLKPDPDADLAFGCEVLYYEGKTATSFRIAAEPNELATLFHARYPDKRVPPAMGFPVRRPRRGTGSSVSVRDPVGGPPFVVWRGSHHEAGASVTLYGYTGWLTDEPGAGTREAIRPGRVQLMEPLAENTPWTLVYLPKPPGYDPIRNRRPVVVKADDTLVPVISAGNLPAQGFVRIGAERAFYRGVVPDPQGAYVKLVIPLEDRGLSGTVRSLHNLWEPVVLESIRVSDNGPLLDRSFVQLTPGLGPSALESAKDPRRASLAEWVAIEKPEPRYGNGYLLIPANATWQGDPRWLPALELLFGAAGAKLPNDPGVTPVAVAPDGQSPALPFDVRPVNDWLSRTEVNGSRAVLGTTVQDRWSRETPRFSSAAGGRAHAAGELVLPCFTVGSTQNGALAGPGDVVTLAEDGTSSREEHTIVWVSPATAPGIAPGIALAAPTPTYAALEAPVLETYAGAAHARLARFPTGQLPYGPPDLTLNGATAIDELLTTQEEERSFQDFAYAFTARVRALGAEEVVLSCPRGVPALGTFCRVDDELFSVNAVFRSRFPFVKLLRGVLGTAPATHGPEALVWRGFPFPHLAIAEPGEVAGNASIGLRGNQPALLHDRSFFVGVDRGGGAGIEGVLPIDLQQGPALLRPRDRFGKGCYRSAFGSGSVGALEGGELLFDWPFRYHDRYAPEVSSLDGVFFAAGKELPGALFESITWDATLPNPWTKVVVAVRVDGAPSWDASPERAHGEKAKRLYVFDDPKGANRIDVHGDRVEMRVYLTYKSGAFLEDGWKETPVLKAVRLTYRQPTRVRRREELPE
jgi:hypothetical protein